jgi:hypothetical protein
MSWVGVGVAAVGAVKGGLDAKSAKKKQAKHDAFRKASIQYSPWSGMGDPGAGNFGNTDAMSGMLGGGLQGYALGSMAGGAMGGAAGGANGGQGISPASAQTVNKMQNAVGAGQVNLGGGTNPWGGSGQMKMKNPFLSDEDSIA